MRKEKIERLVAYYQRSGLTERQIKNRLAKEEKIEQIQRNQKPVRSITITIGWKKSRTWGSNPHATAEVEFQDGTFYRDTKDYTCTGYGYDKESTVIADIFNKYLIYTLWQLEGKEVHDKPYGVYLNFDYSPFFDGGIGTNCYYRIAEFIGGKFEHISGGKTFDVYKFTMNQ